MIDIDFQTCSRLVATPFGYSGFAGKYGVSVPEMIAQNVIEFLGITAI